MLRILTLVSNYLPGYKAGGPARTLANVVEWLGDEYHFLILTADRDVGEKEPYPGIRPGVWNRIGKASVLYLSPDMSSVLAWRHRLRTIPHDVLYLNSFFWPTTVKLLLLRRLRQIPRRPVVLAPRGEFSAGALALKGHKKHGYMWFAKRLSLYSNLIWQVSSELEEQDVLAHFGEDIVQGRSKIVVAPNLAPRAIPRPELCNRLTKQSGKAHIAFVSRVTRKKNLDFALRQLARIRGDIAIDIYGPVEDQSYWRECLRLIESLPPNVEARYCGPIRPERVPAVLAACHLLFLPSRGENFGHVILEALCAGCPVLISNRTPWRELTEKHAGWDLPLEQPEGFWRALDLLVAMDEEQFRRWSQGALALGQTFVQDTSIVTASRKLFLTAAGMV